MVVELVFDPYTQSLSFKCSHKDAWWDSRPCESCTKEAQEIAAFIYKMWEESKIGN